MVEENNINKKKSTKIISKSSKNNINEIKLFDKWSFSEVIVSDAGLEGFINVDPIIIPRSNGYYHNSAFYKTKVNIVERLMNRLQVTGHKGKKHKISTGHNTGKAKKIANLVFEVLTILEQKTKENPIQVLVKAIENAAPREEVITIERAGARYAQAVDCAPQRRVDLVLRFICQGAAHKAFNGEKKLQNCLVEEIIDCLNQTGNSMAMSKRNEIEKMAAAAK